MQLTNHQQQIFTALQRFVDGDHHDTFLLKGYAGTGKTTLVGFLLRWLAERPEERHVEPVLLSSTGRAAKVLSRKTGAAATTVHSHLYRFEQIDDGGTAGDADYTSDTPQLALQFGLRAPEQTLHPRLYLIDEASMLSHLESSSDNGARFGSGRMLTDFFHFVGKDKVVFIGDPLQLPPPVGEAPFSSALDADFLREHYTRRVVAAELTEVIRQAADNPVLALATQLREHVRTGCPHGDWQALLRRAGGAFYTPYNQQLLAERYLAATREHYGRAVIITHSNKQTFYLNQTIRGNLFKGQNLHRLKRNELLQVVQNNHLVPLANGDQVLVRRAKALGKSAGFFFLEAEVEDVNNGTLYTVPLLYDFLFDARANLGGDDFRRLLIDFDRRARKRGLRRRSEGYLDALRADPYLNALRAKFGYAVTCHKAQGGEWDTVFLNLSNTIDLLPVESRFRWLYTAVTRAAKTLEIKHIYHGTPSTKPKPGVRRVGISAPKKSK